MPHDAYFSTLNALLKREGPGYPVMLVDLERLERNCARLRASIPKGKTLRIVAKSLPSPKLLDFVLKATNTRHQMAFHLPFLLQGVRAFPDSEFLLGKPMPLRAAETFYQQLGPSSFPSRQLQWLMDTQPRLLQYLHLAQKLGLKLRVNLEIDIGLHRGGFVRPQDLEAPLSTIQANGDHLEFAGFMGYDAHVGKLPGIIEKPETTFQKTQAAYQAFVDYGRERFPDLFSQPLTFNGAGSLTFSLHAGSLVNDISAGSVLVRPTDFDTPLLEDFEPACFIATPVLKVLEGGVLPGLESLAPLVRRLKHRQRSYFIYGGRWIADYASPPGLADFSLYGSSFNQAIVTGSAETALEVDDYIFLRPKESESLMLQFGDLRVVREGQMVDRWATFTEN